MKPFALISAMALMTTASYVAAAPDNALSVEETRAVAYDYAKCVVARQSRKASEAILANVDNETLLKRYPSLVIGDCLVKSWGTGRMSFPGSLYSYGLADALVNRELIDRPAPDLSSTSPLAHREPPIEPSEINANGKRLGRKKYVKLQEDYMEELSTYFLSRYGECIVRADAKTAKALVFAKPDTDEERAAFGALIPVLQTCLPPEKTIKFGKVPLRGTIALNYYRLAYAAGVAPMKAGN